MDNKEHKINDHQIELFAKNLRYYIDQSGKQQNEIAKDLNFPAERRNLWQKILITESIIKNIMGLILGADTTYITLILIEAITILAISSYYRTHYITITIFAFNK